VNARQSGSHRGNGDLIRVIIDTSAFIRYLIRPSAALRELIEVLWLGDQIEMVTCPELLAELEDVLQRDYIRALVQPDDAEALLDAIRRKAEFLPALGVIPSYTRDRKDDKFIACAIAGHVRYIITVDKDLLDLETFLGIQLLAPHKFLEGRRGAT
jgi:putative PIN family toxin of toxin-antitoxin system